MAIRYELLGYHDVHSRVRFGESDAYGCMWHGHALARFESARAELARMHGPRAEDLLRDEMSLPMADLWCRFVAPAFSDEPITTQISLLRPQLPVPFLTFLYRIVNAEGAELIVGRTNQVLLRQDTGRVIPKIPGEVRAQIESAWAYLDGCPRWESTEAWTDVDVVSTDPSR